MLRTMMDAFSKGIGEELRNEPESEGDLWMGLATGCAEIGDYSRAITNSLQALDAYRAAFGSEQVKVAWALNRLGRYQSANNEVSKGRTNAQLAVTVARKCGNSELLAVCLLDAAKSFNNSGEPTPETIPLLRESLHLRRTVVPSLLSYLDATRSLVRALRALVVEGRAAEAKAILNEELKSDPSNADLLDLLKTFGGEQIETTKGP
jgi:tetratricopeptide (TPR) repeat protein